MVGVHNKENKKQKTKYLVDVFENPRDGSLNCIQTGDNSDSVDHNHIMEDRGKVAISDIIVLVINHKGNASFEFKWDKHHASGSKAPYETVGRVGTSEEHIEQLDGRQYQAESGSGADAVKNDVSHAVPDTGGTIQEAGGSHTPGDHEGDAADGGGQPVLVQENVQSLLADKHSRQNSRNFLESQKLVHVAHPQPKASARDHRKCQELQRGVRRVIVNARVFAAISTHARTKKCD